jgi:hypothetical protein
MILEGYVFLNCFLITTNNYNQQLHPTITTNNYNQQLQTTITSNNYNQQLQPTINIAILGRLYLYQIHIGEPLRH